LRTGKFVRFSGMIMEQNETLNAANAQADGAALLEVGTWIGRHQAFSLIANKCSGADAACLREIRENKHYKALGLTWEEFCSRHTGVDRRTADRIVERLEEFGEAYFNLSQLMPIQPSGYRELASSVTGNTLELDGQKIAITPEHASRIIDAVRELRSRLEREQLKSRAPFSALQNRLDRCHSELAGAIGRGVDDSERMALIALLAGAISRFEEARQSLAAIPSED
jgi:hypothetical protein